MLNNIQAWCNYKGSHMNKEYPWLKIHWTFEKPVTADHIIKAMYDNKERMKWDDKVSEIITIKDDHPNLSVVILRNHKVLVIEARQFIEKRVIFKEYEDSQFPNKMNVYVYISSLPDDKLKEYEVKYSDPKTKHVTCATIFTVMKITYDTKLQDGCELVMYTQNDAKLNAFVRAFGIILIHLFCNLIKILIVDW